MSPRASFGRIAAVTGAIAAIGVVVGAAIGTTISLGIVIRWERSFTGALGPLAFGALAGGVIGAVAAPLLAWVFLRRVTLGRAIAETSIGTLIGGLIGVMLPPLIIPAALAGFLVAGIRLYVVSRRGATPPTPRRIDD